MNFQVMLNLQGMLFLLTLLGVYARKRNIITPEARAHLSDLLIEVILPMNILSSFDMQLDSGLLKRAALALGLSFGVQILSLIVSRFLYRKADPPKQSVLRYSTVVSNAGFMGLPIVRAAMGTEAALYAAIALIPIRVFMWSAGLSLFTKTDAKSALKRLVTHPCNIAVAAGFVVLLIPGGLPDVLSGAVSSVGSCATAVSMLIIGGFLAEIEIKSVITKDTLFYSSLRLIMIPLAVFGLMSLLKVDRLLAGAIILLAAMPAGSTTAILAAKYGGDAAFAAKIIFVSTVLSLVTIPVFSFLAA
jgi:malate permease and related proteins